MIKKTSHVLFLYIQKQFSTIPWVRFVIKWFDKRIDYVLGVIVTLWIVNTSLYVSFAQRAIVVGSFLILFIITTIIKYTVHEPRPFVTYGDRYDSPNHFGRNDSFPSNHTVYFFGLATVATLLLGYIIWPLYVLAAFIGITRVIGGVHYPHDVLAGMLFGTMGVWLITILIKILIVVI